MAKKGRRPRGRTPMPNTTITALTEELAFLTLLGDGSTSLGVQMAVKRLTEMDPNATAMYRQAMWMCNRAEEYVRAQIGSEVRQIDVYKYLSAHLLDLKEEWRDAHP